MEQQHLDVYAQARALIRADGFGVTPWRLGKKLGQLGLDVPSPYSHPKTAALFADGLRRELDAYKFVGRTLWSELRRGHWQAAA